MKRVTGIGGIFFEAKDPAALRGWYRRHVGIGVQDCGGAAFAWADEAGMRLAGTTIWSVGGDDGDYFAPSSSAFMSNDGVADLAAPLKVLREEGCDVLDKTDDSEFGKCRWVMDPEGKRVELWQPTDGK